MPRETVRSADYHFVPIPNDADAAFQPWDAANRLGVVEVGWHKAPQGHVEVVTADEAMLHGPDGLYAQVARAVQDKTDVEVVVRDFFKTGGFWISLDREGCNTLIKRIRKARDDAFGRDE